MSDRVVSEHLCDMCSLSTDSQTWGGVASGKRVTQAETAPLSRKKGGAKCGFTVRIMCPVEAAAPPTPDGANDLADLIDSAAPEWTIAGVDPGTGERYTGPVHPNALLWACQRRSDT